MVWGSDGYMDDGYMFVGGGGASPKKPFPIRKKKVAIMSPHGKKIAKRSFIRTKKTHQMEKTVAKDPYMVKKFPIVRLT